MAAVTTGVLGIEIGSDQLRVVHGALSGNLLKVYDFTTEEILVANPETIPQQLDSLVERKQLRSYPVALTLSGPGVVHRVLDFPSMPLGELGVVVEREVRVAAGAGAEEAAFDWEVIEERDSGNLREARVLVAIATKSDVQQAQELLDRCRLRPALFTTPPVSLLRSLRFAQRGGEGLQAVLYITGQHGYLLGVKDGIWSFYREFSTRGVGKGVDDLLDEAVTEANRALLYHRQRYRDAGEMSFLLGGQKGLEELQARLQRETGNQGEVVRASPQLDLSALAERGNIFRDQFPSFLISIGLVAAACLPMGINLAPKGLRKSVRQRPVMPSIDWSFFQRPGLVGLLLLLFLGVHLAFVFTERYYQKLLKGRAALYEQWAPAIQAAQESQVLRENEKLLAQSVGSSRVGETSWTVLFKSLSRLAPPGLVLYSMALQRDKAKGIWLVVLKGQVVAADSYAAQAAFNRFYQGLKGSPYYGQIELLPLDISNITERPEGQAAASSSAAPTEAGAQLKTAAGEMRKTKVQFEIRAQSKGT